MAQNSDQDKSREPSRNKGGGVRGEGPAFDSGSKYVRVGLGVIIAASAGLGAVSVVQYMKSPFFFVPILDEAAYVDWAMEIAAGGFLGKEIFYQDPLYPYFLALIFKMFGKSFLLPRLIHVVMGAGCVYLVFRTARELLGERAALLAAVIMAGYGGLYFFELLLLKAVMVIFLSALSCALGVAAAARPESLKRFFPLGLCLGLLTLLRGNFLAVAPLLAIWAFFAARETRVRRALRAAALAGGFLVIILPVTLRNYLVAGEFVVTTSQAGSNFYIGNNESAGGQYIILPFVRAHPEFQAEDFRSAAERRLGRAVTDSEASRFWMREGLSWIGSHPAQAAGLWLHKARLLIHNFEIPNNHSLYLVRNVFVPALWIPALGFGLLWGPALLGAVVISRRDRRALFPALFALLYILSLIPFFIMARYRVAVVPAMAVFAAASVSWFIREFRAGRMRSVAVAVVWLAASAALGFYPTAESRDSLVEYEYYLLGNAYMSRGKPAEAVAWYDKALAGMPDDERVITAWTEAVRVLDADAVFLLLSEADRGIRSAHDLFEIGERLSKLGRPGPAIKAYEAALEMEPDYFPAHARLGSLYAGGPGVENLAEALGHIGRAVALRPDYMRRTEHLDALNDLGELYLKEGDSISARRWWDEALKIDPGHREARENLEALEGGE
jgi:tetratricopeptide (TPR) repeat protein